MNTIFLKRGLLISSLIATSTMASFAAAECKKLGYIESVSVDPEFNNARIVLREVAGSGNTWASNVVLADAEGRAVITVAANAATSGAKVRVEGDAASCPPGSPLGQKFMGTVEQFSIVTSDIND